MLQHNKQTNRPDITFLLREEVKSNLLGILVTHAHEDHVGAFPFLWNQLEVPVYATPLTAEFIRQKVGRNQPHWKTGPAKRIDIREISLAQPVETIGPFEVTWFPVTHSIPESNALVIKTDKGTLFHTGDWKIDNNPTMGPKIDFDELARLGQEGVMAVIGDSTNAERSDAPQSEGDLRESMVDLFAFIQDGGSARAAADTYETRSCQHCFKSGRGHLDGVCHGPARRDSARTAHVHSVCLIVVR